MTPETIDLYSKYRYFMFVLSNERLQLFLKDENELDFDTFFDYYNMVLFYHWLIKPIWKNFRNSRYQMIKRFEKKKSIIKRRAYMNILNNYFCYDISNLICEFLVK